MSNPFAGDAMAAGYAKSRPAVHPRVIDQVWSALDRREPFARALDIGCGAGLSTRALEHFAQHRIGMEPAASMLRWAPAIAPGAGFLVGTAEAIPLGRACVDLITAAGSLNYVDLSRFFPEARRVLLPEGLLVVYDFSPGKSFRQGTELDEWFHAFQQRFPPPAQEARVLNPEILAAFDSGFRLDSSLYFEIVLPLSGSFYVNYMMTETNVAAATRHGTPGSEIQSWCTETLGEFWASGDQREVLFRGYFACMRLDASPPAA